MKTEEIDEKLFKQSQKFVKLFNKFCWSQIPIDEVNSNSNKVNIV